MTNLEKYNNIFMEVFGVDPSEVNETMNKNNIGAWDSVHQLTLVSEVEEKFDIMLEPDDIMNFTSYAKGKDILIKNEIML